MNIHTGDFYYFHNPDAIWLVTAISDRVNLTLADGNHSIHISLLPEYIYSFGRYLGNIETTPTSQLKNFYPELFI